MPEPFYTLESLEANNSIGYLIKRCGTLMVQLAEQRFESQPISFTQWIVLTLLSQHDHLTPTELSDHLGHDMGALTRVVDDLQERKLVRRERSEQDRRAVEITATAEGRRMATTRKTLVVDLVNELIEPYSRHETEMLISLLQRMLVHMEKVASKSPAGAASLAPSADARSTPSRRRK